MTLAPTHMSLRDRKAFALRIQYLRATEQVRTTEEDEPEWVERFRTRIDEISKGLFKKDDPRNLDVFLTESIDSAEQSVKPAIEPAERDLLAPIVEAMRGSAVKIRCSVCSL